jgi:hypothetical protein
VTPVHPTARPASTAGEVVRQAGAVTELAGLDAAVGRCRACPRLVEWREGSPAKRAAFKQKRTGAAGADFAG